MTRRRLLPALAVTVVCLAQIGFAQFISELNPFPRHFPTKGRFVVEFAKGGGGSNLVYHNGPVMPQAHVVPIFWGPSWGTGGSDHGIATSLTSYIGTNPGYGHTGEYNVITQYYQTGPVYIQQSSLNVGAIFDSSTLPTNICQRREYGPRDMCATSEQV